MSMQGEFIKSFVHEALSKSMKKGGVTFIEEMAEGLSVEQLEKFIDILNRVLNKKRNVVDVK